MPAASRITDTHSCPAHGGGPTSSGEGTVLIGFQPAARVGDKLECGPASDAIAEGEASVIIGGKNAARLGDPTSHGGSLTMGCPTVNIGSSPQGVTLRTDAPFCEECAEKAERRAARRRRGK